MNIYATSPLEIRLERRQSPAERITAAALIFGFMAFAPAIVFLQDSPSGIIGKTVFIVIAWLFLVAMLLGTTLADDVRWTIQFGKIRVDRESVFGRKRLENIAIGDISETSVHRYDSEAGVSFCVKLVLNSGKRFYSPIIKTESQAKTIEARIRTWLQVGAA